MKQGRASTSGPADRKVEPSSRAVNPGGTNNIGRPHSNHATDSGTFIPHPTPLYAGRGYEAPSIGATTHNKGSQGKH